MKKTLLFAAIAAAIALVGCEKQPEIPVPVAVEKVTVKASLALELGAKKTLAAFVWPEDAANRLVSWASDRPGVATIDPETGEVTAVGIGEATITVTTTEGGKTAKSVVTVALTDIIGQIPDPQFRAWCRKQIYLDETWDTNRDGKLSSDEAAHIQTLELPHGGTDWDAQITSLAGIEYFTNLRELICVGHRLTELDLSRNTKLVSLLCYGNMLTSLDLSHNPDMYDLQCARNELAALDVSKNPLLVKLTCADNRLTSLDVTGCDRLENLNCWKNQIRTLDLSTCAALRKLQCSRNGLTALDLSKNVWLVLVECGWGPLATLDLPKNAELISLSCDRGALTSLDLSNCQALDYLDCSGNRLTSLDVSRSEYLRHLNCGNNQLSALDVTGNSLWLTDLFCDKNPGDGSVFPVTAWFDNDNIPGNPFGYIRDWQYDGKKITIDFRKTKQESNQH